jgi:ubiquinone/menaquinone biosynthesis C-methylase UbiE
VSWSTPGSDTKRLVAAAYDRSADGFAGAADRVVYRYLALPLIEALGSVQGAVLDVAAGAGAAGRHFHDTVALDLSMGQLRHNPTRRRLRADAERLPLRADSFAAAVCLFGINHFPDPAAAVTEMARVASVVGVTTWARPEPQYAPKTIVLNTLERHAGRSRSTMGEVVDSLADRVGSVAGVAGLLERAGLDGEVEAVTVTIPWPGTEAFLDYRLSMASTAGLVADARAVRQEAATALAGLAEDELDWHAAVIVGVGQRA